MEPSLLSDVSGGGSCAGRRASSGQVLCPDGEVCTPDIAGFNPQDGWTLKYATKPCPEGSLCPAGTSEATLALGLNDCQVRCLVPPPLPMESSCCVMRGSVCS